MRKHGQKIVFRSVRSLNHFLLLFDRSLSAVAFCDRGGNGHGRDRQRRCPRLQHQKRLVLRLQDEGPESMERSPNCDGRENKDASRGFARGKSKCSPDDDRTANKGNWIIAGGNGKPSAKHGLGQQHQ